MVSINLIDFISQIADHIPFQVVWFDSDAKVANGNQAWVKAMGYAKLDELLGKTPHDFLSAEQAGKLSEQISLVLKSGKMQVDKVSGNSGTDKVRNTVTAGYPLPDENDAVTGVLVISFEGADSIDSAHVLSEYKSLQTKSKPHAVKNPEPDQVEKLLLSGLLHQLLNETGSQYRNRQLYFQIAIADKAQFAFVIAQPAQLHQSIAYLIKRAAENVSAKKNARITLKLDANAETVTLTVHDNGKGLNFEALDHMLNRENHLGDNAASIDPGMQQIWKMLEQNKGILHVETMLAEGTSILLTFPRATMPDWIATQINLTDSSIVVILDADVSIHKEWNKRLDIYRHLYPDLQLHYYAEGAQALGFIAGLSKEDADRVVLLSDYELTDQNMNGLQMIETGKIRNSTLVTRLHASTYIQNSVARTGAKMLPKHLLGLIPIQFSGDPAN